VWAERGARDRFAEMARGEASDLRATIDRTIAVPRAERLVHEIQTDLRACGERCRVGRRRGAVLLQNLAQGYGNGAAGWRRG
jgi:hypothetical protein